MVSLNLAHHVHVTRCQRNLTIGTEDSSSRFLVVMRCMQDCGLACRYTGTHQSATGKHPHRNNTIKQRTIHYCITHYVWKKQSKLELLLHPFNGLFSTTTWVSWYQKGKTSQDLNEARDYGVWGWQWYQVDHKQTIWTSLQADKHTNSPTPHQD